MHRLIFSNLKKKRNRNILLWRKAVTLVTKTHLLEKLLDHDDDEQEVNRTQPFKLVEASTAKPGGETIEMQTMQHEQSGLPDTSYEEIH